MKSPREILLQKYGATAPRLDRIRQDVLAGELGAQAATRGPANTDSPDHALGFAQKLWRELIWPCRQVWMALGVVWLALGVFTLATRSHAPREHRPASAALPTSLPMSFAEQHQWISELTQLRPDPPVKPSSGVRPKPRSEGPAVWRIT
jgi:hypothetical protein